MKKRVPKHSPCAWAIPTNEELMIAMDTAAIVKAKSFILRLFENSALDLWSKALFLFGSCPYRCSACGPFRQEQTEYGRKEEENGGVFGENPH